jgi:hypothetical protein
VPIALVISSHPTMHKRTDIYCWRRFSYDDGEVFHADVCTALGLSRDPQARAFELAMICAGAAPGSFTVTPPGHREAVVSVR